MFLQSKKSKVIGKIRILIEAVEEHSVTQTEIIKEKLLEERPVKLKSELE